MRRKIMPVIIGIPLILFYFAVGSILAAEADENAQEQMMWSFFWAQKDLFDGRLILDAKDKIELTKEQEQKIENKMLAYEEASIRSWAEIKVLELKFASYVKSEKVDRNEIEKVVREISARKTDCIVQYMNYLLDLKEIVTQEQLKKIKAIHKKAGKSIPSRGDFVPSIPWPDTF